MRFNEYLKRNYPRVPAVNSPKERDNDFHVSEEMFYVYVNAGERLRKLHLKKNRIPANLTIEPNNPDNLAITDIRYNNTVLNLNSTLCISGIPEDVWSYRIGGYQVLKKWFKTHKGETLTIDKFEHISEVVGLIAETIKVQEELEEMHDN